MTCHLVTEVISCWLGWPWWIGHVCDKVDWSGPALQLSMLASLVTTLAVVVRFNESVP